MINQMKGQYPIQVLCETLDCPRSSYYYEAALLDDTALVEVIEQILLRFPFYGYRRLTAELGRQGWQLNEKVVRRVMKQLGVKGQVGQVRITTTDSRHNLIRSVTALHPNHLWVAEAVYMQQRVHSALEYLTPIEFEAAFTSRSQPVTLNC